MKQKSTTYQISKKNKIETNNDCKRSNCRFCLVRINKRFVEPFSRLEILPILSADSARRAHVLGEVTVAGESVEIEAALLDGAVPVTSEHPRPARVVELAALQVGRVAPVSSAATGRGQAARRRGVVGQLARTFALVEHRVRRAGPLPNHRAALAPERRLAVGVDVGVLAVGSVHAGVGPPAARGGHVRHGGAAAPGARVEVGTGGALVVLLQQRLLALVVERAPAVGVSVQTVLQSAAQGQAEPQAGASAGRTVPAGRGDTCSEEWDQGKIEVQFQEGGLGGGWVDVCGWVG